MRPLDIDVYGEIRGATVYYQIAYASGRLNCQFKTKSSSSWRTMRGSNYHIGYAECAGWAKGNPEYDIKLELNGKEYLTDEETAVAKGPYLVSGKLT